MAKNGLSTFLHAPLQSYEPLTYGTPNKLGGAIQCASNITYGDGTIMSDNRLKHQDKSFASGSLTLTVDYAKKDVFSPILGRRVVTETFTPPGGTEISIKRHISNTEDLPTRQGFGYIVNDLDVYNEANKKPVYTVKFFYDVEFGAPTEDEQTKQGARTYAQSSVIGTIYELENGDWCEEVDFEKLSDAVAYLYYLYGATSGGGVDLSALTIGSISLTPAFSQAVTIYLASTTNTTNVVTATSAAEGATVAITLNGSAHTSGQSATWASGLNEVKITVTNGETSKVYTVIVTKETE